MSEPETLHALAKAKPETRTRKRLPSAERLVLEVTRDMTDPGAWTRLSDDDIGQLAGLPANSVGIALNGLEEDGLVQFRNKGRNDRTLCITEAGMKAFRGEE